jgi:hypothetical protein
MLSYMNSDLIKQPFSYEAVYTREYRPTRQYEQYILDHIALICIVIDAFVISTFVSMCWFPDSVHTIQANVLSLIFALYIGKEIGEFIYQMQRHCEFVNTNKQFIVPSWENPNMKYICKLEWMNPENFLDFRTVVVYVVTFPTWTPTTPTTAIIVAEPQQHPYNTRSKARSVRQHVR